jgi:hypothetical protein
MSRSSDRPLSLEQTAGQLVTEPTLPLPRTQTGIRRREPSLSGEALPVPDDGPGPESLRRPYAVLESRRPPSESSPVSTVQPKSAAKPTTESKRSIDPAEARRRGLCAKHGIARSPTGVCLLCEKEAPKKSARWGLWVGATVAVIATASALLFAL